MLKRVAIGIVLVAVLVLSYLYGQAAKSHDPPADHRPGVVRTPGNTTTIAFGSCNRQDEPQGYWETIGQHRADAWLWLGDNIYADTEDMEEMAADYAGQRATPAYATFIAATPQVYGTWDDHDYGENDGGKEWPHKEAAETLLLDFLAVPDGAEVRQRPGVYQAYMVGDIKVILLDTRSFRDALADPVRAGDRYGPNPDGDILGEAQWRWLADELRDSPARAHLIASSIQVLPTDHGYEKWANFPTARTRLLRLLEDTRPALPLLLSGDRHLAEISRDSVGNYPIYELTSSGLTHTYEDADEANDKRLGELITERNYGLLHYTETEEGLQLRAEVRGISDGGVLATLLLPAGSTNNAGRPALGEANTAMSRTLKPCPSSPNCVSTQSTQPKKKRDPIPFTGSAEETKEKLKRVVGDMSRTQLVEEDGNYLHYTFKTWPIPYIDDVEFIVDPNERVIHYRSASRVGHSDLGVNSRRMAKVVAAMAAD